MVSSLFDPVCICNWQQHDTMNKKILQHASSARIVQRTIPPRPMMDNRCTTHRPYQPTETVASRITHNRNEKPRTVNEQFSQLTDVNSQLRGLCRSSAYNTMPAPALPIPNHSAVWDAFPDRPVVSLRSHSPTPTTCTYSKASAQTRSPFMHGAPDCQPTMADEDVHAWHNNRSAYRTEAPRWNNHPFVLETVGVNRQLAKPTLVSPVQNAFENSTRRKLNIR